MRKLSFARDYLPMMVASTGLIGWLSFMFYSLSQALSFSFLHIVLALFVASMVIWALEDQLTAHIAAHLITFIHTAGAVLSIQLAAVPAQGLIISDYSLTIQLALAANALYCHGWYVNAFQKGGERAGNMRASRKI